MRFVIVGADFEENLGVGYIAAAAMEAGHEVRVVTFNEPGAIAEVTRQVMAARPEVVGLSIQFQHRAHEFLALAERLRRAGLVGHLTCGGQFPTLAWREVLGGGFGLDSVVLHEGERTIVELLDAIEAHRPLAEVAGVALLTDDGAPHRTAGRPLASLDDLPVARRYRDHARHMGVPFIPVLGSRGCWGACSYCSITSFYRDARAHGGGHTLRLRSPESVAAEMALLWHRAGGPSLFCFHDENLLLPRPADTLERLRAVRRALDGHGVGRVGLVGKCRPDCVTPELARELAALGVVRLYVGVENASERGAGHLNRRTQTRHVHDALAACRQAGIFVCYNLLVFEPDATVDDVRDNVRFMREHAEHPMNFCRAEAYYGTPLQLSLAERQSLGGSFLGWNYRAADDRTELLFRICSAAFRQRNFDPEGAANRSMGLGYSVKVLEHFHDDPEGRCASLAERAEELTRGLVLETAGFLEEAIVLAESLPLPAVDSGDRAEHETGLLGLRIAAADARWHRQLDELYGDMERHAAQARRPRRALRLPRALLDAARNLAVGASLAAIGGCGHSVVDPVPPDGFIVDPVPADMARDIGPALDLDPAPFDLGQPDMSHLDGGRDIGIIDPLPPDMTLPDARPLGLLEPERRPGSLPLLDERRGPASDQRLNNLIDQWRETSPARAVRSDHLPLFAPPQVHLAASVEGDGLRVRIVGGPAALGTRWECDGAIDLDGRDADSCRELRWRPSSPQAQIRVGVRVRGGVAVLAQRAADV